MIGKRTNEATQNERHARKHSSHAEATGCPADFGRFHAVLPMLRRVARDACPRDPPPAVRLHAFRCWHILRAAGGALALVSHLLSPSASDPNDPTILSDRGRWRAAGAAVIDKPSRQVWLQTSAKRVRLWLRGRAVSWSPASMPPTVATPSQRPREGASARLGPLSSSRHRSIFGLPSPRRRTTTPLVNPIDGMVCTSLMVGSLIAPAGAPFSPTTELPRPSLGWRCAHAADDPGNQSPLESRQGQASVLSERRRLVAPSAQSSRRRSHQPSSPPSVPASTPAPSTPTDAALRPCGASSQMRPSSQPT